MPVMKLFQTLVVLFSCFVASSARALVIPTNAPPTMHIVTLRQGADMEAVLLEYQLTPKYRYRALNGFAARISESAVQRLKADPRVMFVEADGPVKLCGQTVWEGVTRMGVERFPVARINGTSEPLDVDVAIMDSGINPHPDLPPSYASFSSWSITTDDEIGHGTRVAGVVAATDNRFRSIVGVAPGVRIWNIKTHGPPPAGSWTDVIGGMEILLEYSNRVSVVNMSFTNPTNGDAPIDAIRFFLKSMVEAGMVVVASAGNETNDLAGVDGVYGTGDDALPASDPYVMAVSAMNPFTDTFAPFSNFSQIERTNGYPINEGPSLGTNFVNSPGGAIDVAAPGITIVSTNPDGTYGYASGTSFAAPHVAGLVALYIAANGRATNAAGVFAIRQAIINASLPQLQWRTNDTLDPDSFPEPLAMASESWVPQPAITQVSGTPDNFQIQFAAVPGYDYTVQTATNLTPSIQWSDVATVTRTGAVATVSVTDTNSSDQRFYRLARKSPLGPFTILSQPQNVTTPAGTTAKFSVDVLTNGTFSFLWHKNGAPLTDGANITGSTSNNLVLANVQPADAGDFSVLVTNPYGSLTSSVATLTVLTNWTTAFVTGVLATATSEVGPPYHQYASNAVNGVYGGGYAWGSVGVNQGLGVDVNPAITFDLRALRPLEKVEIWNSEAMSVAVKDMNIEVSSDGTNFSSLGGFTLTTNSPASETIGVGGVECRYVRFVTFQNGAGQHPGGGLPS